MALRLVTALAARSVLRPAVLSRTVRTTSSSSHREVPGAVPASPAPQKEVSEKEVPARQSAEAQPEGEVDGPKGPEPTRYGDWERKGRCSDF